MSLMSTLLIGIIALNTDSIFVQTSKHLYHCYCTWDSQMVGPLTSLLALSSSHVLEWEQT